MSDEDLLTLCNTLEVLLAVMAQDPGMLRDLESAPDETKAVLIRFAALSDRVNARLEGTQ